MGGEWKAATSLSSWFCFWKLGDKSLLTSFEAFVSLLWSLEILKDLDGQALLAACWLASYCTLLLEHQPSVPTVPTVGWVVKGCHMCTHHNWPFLVPRLLSDYLPVCGTHIIALGFWPSVKWGHPGSGLIDCTSEGNKLAFDLVERQGQMCGSKGFSAVSHTACLQVSWKAAWELYAKGSWGH